jgi:hypothetical protein
MTVQQDGDRDLAAALAVAVDAGALSTESALSLIDSTLLEQGEAPPWLIDASLARNPADMLHVLRAAAGDHPMLENTLAALEAIDIAFSAGSAQLSHVTSRIVRGYPYLDVPEDVRRALDLVDEVAMEEYEQGVTAPEPYDKALRSALAAARGRSGWRHVLERVVARA